MGRRIWLALSKSDGFYALNEICQGEHQIVVVPHIPMGYHCTVHDAGQDHEYGVVHVGLDPTKGRMVAYPGGHQISDTRGIAQPERTIPALKDIKGALGLFSPVPLLSLFARRELERQADRRIKELDLRGASLVTVNAVGGWLGWDVLLVEPGNLEALHQWLSGLGETSVMKTTVGLAYLGTEYSPWLAIVAASASAR